jgi:(S)-ureidoglycine aminohydrolase
MWNSLYGQACTLSMNSKLLHNLGHTRASRGRDHLLQTPDTFIRAPLPGMKGCTAVIHAGPALGATFTQYTAEMDADGHLGTANAQRFIYVLEGQVTLRTANEQHILEQREFAYLPTGSDTKVKAQVRSRVAVIEKTYRRLENVIAPELLVSSEDAVTPQPLMGDEDLQVRSLLPDTEAYDFAVNTMTFRPGASLSLVEIHVMEHGLLMLEGGGIYRLGENWYPVFAGDFIWMAPFCPQWFGAIGKTPARYLIYKDWNRHPLA